MWASGPTHLRTFWLKLEFPKRVNVIKYKEGRDNLAEGTFCKCGEEEEKFLLVSSCWCRGDGTARAPFWLFRANFL